MKKNTFYISLLGVIVAVLLAFYLWPEANTDNSITAKVRYGEFKIEIATTGNLKAKDSEDIFGPSGLREFRIWEVKINDMVPDGTVVDSGAWVAELDRSSLINKRKDLETELEKLESQFVKTRLDTSMTMGAAREELINLQYNAEEQEIRLEQSKYEPPATIRQIKIDFEKANRQLLHARKNYKLKLEKAQAEMSDVLVSKNQQERKYENVLKILESFTIKAPKSGMVVYKRSWNDEKQGIGSVVRSWDNVVAELPDLSKMISKTYVNEIDISKVKKGQKVEIGIDAFPEKIYSGIVSDVANIGQQMKNSNAKVFEVIVELNEKDSILRPAMTTKNTIVTNVLHDVLYIPLEALNNNDSLSFVVTKKRLRKEVKLGKSNEHSIVILKGLKKDEEVFLIAPQEFEKYKFVNLENN
ncbi:MAG: efflux RND transporter periplasmic adaptor subunit [Bacteroidota bacterium]|nr:efflux RND transporter periplasmic adaptor subunit [Bacteroidota bacterium]